MPYNTTAIPPRKEPTGQAQLPLSRIKRIIAQDPDIAICSNNAAFVITLAAEMFIQHLAEESHTQAKVDTKPRRNIQYKDVANAVVRQDNLEFLEDVVPKTVPYKVLKGNAGKGVYKSKGVEERPVTANGAAGPSTVVHESPSIVNGDSSFAVRPPTRERAPVEEQDPSDQLELEMRQARGNEDVQMTG